MPISGGPVFTGIYDAYVCVRDKKTQNTHGGTFTSGDWRTRDLNEELADIAGIASVASNQITLEAGTYRCLIYAPAYAVNSHQAILYNVTTAAVLVVGTSTFAYQVHYVQNRSIISGRFTLTNTSVLEVRHRCSATQATTGWGTAANYTDEIYTVVELWREAS